MTVEFDRVVERDLNAGYALFEVVGDEDAALRDSWGDDDGSLGVQTGRVGVVSAAQGHYPEIILTSFQAAPGPIEAGYELFGQVDVEFNSGQVELWASGADIGEGGPLRLPRPRTAGTCCG